MIRDFSMIPNEQVCLQCGKELHGRIDKRFCNDTCRNTYNRRKRKEWGEAPSPEAERTIRLIRRNFEILQRFVRSRGTKCVISRHELTEQNFHFKFCTSIYQTQKGEIYFFCFEYGWKATSDGKIILVYDESQVWI